MIQRRVDSPGHREGQGVLVRERPQRPPFSHVRSVAAVEGVRDASPVQITKEDKQNS